MTQFLSFSILLGLSSLLTAQGIGIDFIGSTSTALGSGTAGAHLQQANWNAIPGINGTNISLKNSIGANTTATLTFSAGLAGNTNNLTPDNGDRHMMSGWVGLNSSDPGNIQISNIPATLVTGGYDLYVYSDSDAIGKAVSFTLNGTTHFLNEVAGTEQIGENPNQFAGKFIEGSGTSLTQTNEGNFTIFRNLTSSMVTLTANSTSGRAVICGIQIVPHRTYHSHATLIGLYQFNGNSSNNNPIYSGRNGSNDSVTFSSPGWNGSGQALQLSGGGDSVNFNYSLCHERTFVMRLNLDSLPSSGNLATILEGNHFTAGFRYLEPWLGVNSSGQIELRAEHINTGGPILRTQALNTGQWYHIVYTTNSFESRIYIDGVLAASGAPTLMPSENIYLGAQGNNSEDNTPDSIFGKIDEFRIYRGWLGPDYVAELFNPGATVPTKAILPFPSDTIKGVPVDKTLEWTPFSVGTTRDVYLGTSPVLTAADRVLTSSTATSYDPPSNLVENTTYYWRVDEINAHGTTTGNVWSFTTSQAAPTGAVDEFTVLTWNIWSGGNRADPIHGRKFVREVIENSGADVVLFQENGGFTSAQAAAMGFPYTRSAGSSNRAIMSKYPITTGLDGSGQIGGRVQISASREVDVYSLHLTSTNDGANIAGNSSFTNAGCISADSSRASSVSNFLSHVSSASGNNPTIIGGDYNTCSHLDFIESNSHHNFYRGDLVWPTMKNMDDAGFVDSLRQLAPDPTVDQVITWTPFFIANHGEGRGGKARIDLLHHKGSKLTPLSWQFIDFHYHPVTMPADHGGFAVTYRWGEIEKAHNPDPAHGYRVTNLNPTLTWSQASDMTNQKVYFGTQPNLTTSDQQPDTTGGSFTPATLQPCTTYYWRIDTIQADSDVITGDIWYFTTPNTCKATSPSPANFSSGIGAGSLTWTAGIGMSNQRIYFGKQSDLTEADRQPDTTGTSFATGNLLANTTYYWRVDTVLANNDVVTGKVWSFTTGSIGTCANSSSWGYQYEANELLSHASSGSWTSDGGDAISSVNGGILTMTNTSSGDQRYIKNNLINNANGWSIEARVRVTNAGTEPAVWQIIPRDGNRSIRLFVGATGIGNDSSNGNSIVHSFDFTDDFHMIRLALNPTNGQASLWIDGNLITDNFQTSSSSINHVITGNSSSSIRNGSIQIDYFRVEDQWCPPAEGLVDPASYEGWVLSNFATAQTNDAGQETTVWGNNADPDGDNIANLAEFAFGSNPNSNDPTVLPSISPSGNGSIFTYRRRTNGTGITGISYTANDIKYTVQVSQSLNTSDWHSGSEYVEEVDSPVNNGDGTETVSVKIKIPNTPNPERVFARIILQQQ